jgi:hypothetical protein
LNRWELAVGGFLLTVLYDVGTAMIDAVIYNYPWLTVILALYIPFVSGGPSPYPFGLPHELNELTARKRRSTAYSADTESISIGS